MHLIPYLSEESANKYVEEVSKMLKAFSNWVKDNGKQENNELGEEYEK